MKTMKTTYKIMLLALGFAVFAIQGCEDFETEPQDSIVGIDTPDEVAATLFSAYNSIYNMMGNHGNYNSVQEVSSDEALIAVKGGDWGDGGIWVRAHNHTFTPDEGYFEGSWNSCYTAINQINNGFIDFDGNPGLTPEVKSELQALRALYYFFLLDMFGNVPIITEDGNQGQQDRTTVYNFILDEIAAVQPNLSTGNLIGRMDYWTMQALKAKMLINQEVYTGTPTNWQAVVVACDDIIDNGPYSLSSSYQAIFDQNNGGNSEHIYAIPFDEVFGQGFNLGQMTGHYLTRETFGSQDQPWNGYATVTDFYNLYIDSDINPGPQGDVVGLDPQGTIVSGTRDGRLVNFLVGDQTDMNGNALSDDAAEGDDPNGATLTFTPFINELEPGSWRQAGARINKYTLYNGFLPNLNNDKPIFRLTDILLMKAEAMHNMTPGNGLSIVNQIRQRAGVDGFDELNDENLLQERGREMFFEMWRRNDQIRFGTFNDAWQFKGEDPSDHVNIFPIPRTIVEASGLQQNPGY